MNAKCTIKAFSGFQYRHAGSGNAFRLTKAYSNSPVLVDARTDIFTPPSPPKMTARLVLCLGDLFIPDRAPDIPAKFKKLLTPGKIGQILCLGNVTSQETYQFLHGIAPDVQVVKGDFDVEAPNLPLSKVVTHGSLRIGFTHGHTIVPQGDADSLLIAARQLDVDVLLWGGTHRFEAYEMEGKFFVNPGSATGALGTAWWAEGEEPTPSFVLMDVQGDVLVVYVYQLRKDANGDENVGVEKVSFRKNAASVT